MHGATEKVGVGFIGAGQISELHARAYRDNPTGRLVAVADIDPRVAEEKAKLYGAERWYTDYRELLEDESVDAVEVLVPHHLHLPVTLDSLRAGKHTSLQKPMALSADEADQMIAATSASGKLFRVFENFRSYEPFIVAKKMIDDGEIGEPLAIRVKVTGGRGVGGWIQPPPARAWRRDPETGGGPPAIFDHGYHITSIVPFLMGHVEKVHAMMNSDAAGTTGFSGSPAVVSWKHEGVDKYGSWEVVRAPELIVNTDYYGGDEWVEVTGERGVLMVTRCSANLYNEAPVMLARDGKVQRFTNMETDWGESFAAGGKEFTRAITEDFQPDLDGEEAKHCLLFALAAVKSGIEHREVALSELETS